MEYDKTRFLHIAPVEVRSFPRSVDLHDLDPLKPTYSYQNLQYNKVIKYQKQRLLKKIVEPINELSVIFLCNKI